MMRTYGTVSPLFWFGETGSKLKAEGPAAQLMALYLITGPNSNMTGIYHLTMAIVCSHIGFSEMAAASAMSSVVKAGFCKWDEEAEIVFVPMHAKYQIGESLKPGDKQRRKFITELKQFRKYKFFQEFLELYWDCYSLEADFPNFEKTLHAPYSDPCMPLIRTLHAPGQGPVPVPVLAPEGGMQGGDENGVANLSSAGLAWRWINAAKGHAKAELSKIDVNEAFAGMLAMGIPPQVICDEIDLRPPKRDVCEYLWKFKNRVEERHKTGRSANETVAQRQSREAETLKKLRESMA